MLLSLMNASMPARKSPDLGSYTFGLDLLDWVALAGVVSWMIVFSGSWLRSDMFSLFPGVAQAPIMGHFEEISVAPFCLWSI
jgi:hypothetical protein